MPSDRATQKVVKCANNAQHYASFTTQLVHTAKFSLYYASFTTQFLHSPGLLPSPTLPYVSLNRSPDLALGESPPYIAPMPCRVSSAPLAFPSALHERLDGASTLIARKFAKTGAEQIPQRLPALRTPAQRTTHCCVKTYTPPNSAPLLRIRVGGALSEKNSTHHDRLDSAL